METWLSSLKTVIDGLNYLDPKLLPPSFAGDILKPVCEQASFIDNIKMQVKALDLINAISETLPVTVGKPWFFWEKVTRLIADFANAEAVEIFRSAHQGGLNKIHPLQAESEREDTEWPADQPSNLASLKDHQHAQVFLLKLGRHLDVPLVLKLQSRQPFPLISVDRLNFLETHGATLFQLLERRCPSLEPQPGSKLMGSDDFKALESDTILGQDPGFLEALDSVKQAAVSDASVFFKGESGTGKELFARHLHQLSPRKDAPFIPINCSAVPHELIESEMFGHEKGAFTGAYYRKIGKVEQAHGGTLFLDEIGEMPLPFQAKLLRYLQEKKFTRVGGNTSHFSDTRIVVATHRDLKDMVAEKTFREDLYYRIHVIPIVIAPLRDRGRDIRYLSEHFFHKYISKSRASRRVVDETVFDALERYRFPGNVRELDNIIQRTVVMTQKPTINAEDLPDEVHEGSNEQVARFKLHPFEKFDRYCPKERETLRRLKKEVEHVAFSYQRDLDRRFLLNLLQENEGSARKAAEAASINRTLFYKLLKRAGLDIAILNKSEP